MRTSAIGSLVWNTLLCLAVACGKSSDDGGSAGSAGALSAGSNVGGSAAGESSTIAGSTSSGGQSVGSAGAGSAGASSSLLDCDPGKVLCKRTAPECVFGEEPQVVAGCYGECVKVERCACSTAAQCPQPDQYTCWSKSHCGPFVN